jgi:hypothetical protein
MLIAFICQIHHDCGAARACETAEGTRNCRVTHDAVTVLQPLKAPCACAKHVSGHATGVWSRTTIRHFMIFQAVLRQHAVVCRVPHARAGAGRAS